MQCNAHKRKLFLRGAKSDTGIASAVQPSANLQPELAWPLPAARLALRLCVDADQLPLRWRPRGEITHEACFRADLHMSRLTLRVVDQHRPDGGLVWVGHGQLLEAKILDELCSGLFGKCRLGVGIDCTRGQESLL